MLRFDPFGDGYTEPGFIDALPGRHAALSFSFRPALVEESRGLREAAREMTSPDYDRQAAAFTAAKIVDWKLVGRPVPISPDGLLRLPSELFIRLHQIVAGWTASDVDPDWSAETSQRIVAAGLTATRSGRTVGQMREQRDEHNLVMGVNLLLFHPQVLRRSCQSCQNWMYDDRHQLVRRLGQPVRRPPGSPTPCWKCPKRSPAHAAGYERDMWRIRRALRMFFDVRATRGRCLSDRQAGDALLTRHLALVDLIVRRWEALRWRPAGGT